MDRARLSIYTDRRAWIDVTIARMSETDGFDRVEPA
jgi:N-acyl-L-homoserine lactone synthetase